MSLSENSLITNGTILFPNEIEKQYEEFKDKSIRTIGK